MVRSARFPLATALGVLACLALAACGSGSDAKLLPGNTAQEITENLDTVQQLVEEEECISAGDAALEVSTEVESVRGIDPELKEALEKGAARLNEVVAECEVTEETVETEAAPETTEPEDEKEPAKQKPKKEEPAEKEQQEEEKAPPAEAEPPQPKGEAKGNPHVPPAGEAEEEGSSGGIGPGSPVGEGD